MVSAEQLKVIFDYRDDKLYWKYLDSKRKESNTRFAGKESGSDRPDGYRIVTFRVEGKRYSQLLHRVIWAINYDEWPDLIDHIDRDPTNNKLDNLRKADKRINSINTGLPNNNTSGIKGISFNKRNCRWEAYIRNNGKRKHFGLFDCIGQAIKVRKNAERSLWFDVIGNETTV